MTIIAPIKDSDLNMVSSLYKELSNQEQNLKCMKNEFKRMKNNPDYFLIGAKISDRLVGSAMGIICTDLFGECRPFMVIENVIVSNGSTKKGIGEI